MRHVPPTRGVGTLDTPYDDATFGVSEPRNGLGQVVSVNAAESIVGAVVAGALEVEKIHFAFAGLDEFIDGAFRHLKRAVRRDRPLYRMTSGTPFVGRACTEKTFGHGDRSIDVEGARHPVQFHCGSRD